MRAKRKQHSRTTSHIVSTMTSGDADKFVPRGDPAALPDLPYAARCAGPVRDRRPVYVDLLPLCHAGCPAGDNIPARLTDARAGRHQQVWRADVVQWASALLRHGPEYAGMLPLGLCNRMNRNGFHVLNGVRGLLAAPAIEGSETQERADYVWASRKGNSGSRDTYQHATGGIS